MVILCRDEGFPALAIDFRAAIISTWHPEKTSSSATLCQHGNFQSARAPRLRRPPALGLRFATVMMDALAPSARIPPRVRSRLLGLRHLTERLVFSIRRSLLPRSLFWPVCAFALHIGRRARHQGRESNRRDLYPCAKSFPRLFPAGEARHVFPNARIARCHQAPQLSSVRLSGQNAHRQLGLDAPRIFAVPYAGPDPSSRRFRPCRLPRPSGHRAKRHLPRGSAVEPSEITPAPVASVPRNRDGPRHLASGHQTAYENARGDHRERPPFVQHKNRSRGPTRNNEAAVPESVE